MKYIIIFQGSVCVQVNAGPMAYATAFLDPTQESAYPEEDLEQLRDVFRYVELKLMLSSVVY